MSSGRPILGFRSYLLRLTVITAIVGLLYFFIIKESQPSLENIPVSLLIIYFYVISLAGYFLSVFAVRKKHTDFMYSYFGIKLVRLFLSLLIIVVYIISYPEHARAFIAVFMALYILFGSHEIYSVWGNVRRGFFK